MVFGTASPIIQLLHHLFLELLAFLDVVRRDTLLFLTVGEVFVRHIDDVTNAEIVFKDGRLQFRNVSDLVIPSTPEDGVPIRITVVRPSGAWQVESHANALVSLGFQLRLDVLHGGKLIDDKRFLDVGIVGDAAWRLVPLRGIEQPFDLVGIIQAPTRKHGLTV